MIAEYLNVVLAEGNDSDVITAIGSIAKSIGMAKNCAGNRVKQAKFIQSLI